MNELASVPRLTVRRLIQAGAEELFDAWLDPASMAVWMRPNGILRTEASTDPRVGGAYEILMHQAERVLRHTGVYRRIERPRLLVFTWISPATNESASLVTVEFLARDTGTEVVVTHEQLPDMDAVPSHVDGWTQALELLAGHWSQANPA